ncbi:MAG: HAMP domain-containing protein [Proteobacteria bacterium]|nr:HAMP domain-containing protein [Pseudomonadota bacterium]
MPRTLYGKLVLALLALIGVVSIVYVVLSVTTARLHFQEVNQRLNETVARNIVKRDLLIQGGEIDGPAFEKAFDDLMVVNPAIELYLTDPEGAILAFSAPPGKVVRSSISLAPVRAFLEGAAEFPIRGDDPRHPERQKVFSAAPIMDGAELQGYLYIVLGGETYDSVVDMFQTSYILRLGTGIAILSLLLALVAGLLAFKFLTQRLRRLAAEMDAFRRSEFRIPARLPFAPRRAPRDEIDQLSQTFQQMSERITEQFQQLQRADSSRRDLVANVSHDLRTPLTALQGYLETLRLKLGSLTRDEQARYLDLALEHSGRLGQLVDELFELATLEDLDLKLSFEPFSLAELVQDVSQKYHLAAEKKRLRLETDIPRSDAFVSGDIGLIERVLDNLIDNAIKYTAEGGTIRLTLIPGEADVTASVTDTGRGISAAALPHIFERFYRAEAGGRDTTQGTGLGLAIAERILSLHGSACEVESTPGQGSVFSFHLPRASAA